MADIPPVAAAQCGVFSAWQAMLAGWTPPALEHAVRAGRLRRWRVGGYQITDLSHLDSFEQSRWLHAGPAIAGVLATPGARASHSTAAVLHGMPLLFLPTRACAVVPPWLTGELPRVHLHRCTAEPHHPRIGDVGCTGVERTTIDLAREHGVHSGVVAADFALHTKLTDRPRLQDELDRCVRWPGVRAARTAFDLADGRAESPLESRSRIRLSACGLPEPRLQVSLGNEWGGFVGRVDFYWDEFGVVGEADGAQKYDGSQPLALSKEKARQENLEDLGLGVVRWGTPDLQRFEAVAHRLRRKFARGVRPGSPDRRWTVLPPGL